MNIYFNHELSWTLIKTGGATVFENTCELE